MISLTPDQMRTARQSRDKRFDGLFYVGVLSTGIFCRPICPARMAKESNVRYYTDAAQALQAGYRPCKLCKPDQAPLLKHAWKSDSIVDIAIQRIRTQPWIRLTELAKDLGLSTRYLRTCFHKAIGLTPSQFQRSTQLLFAKQLLQQTNMPVIDIAMASGFQSNRSLQQAFQQHFAMSPSSFRKSSQQQDTQLHTTLFLAYRPPYLWQPLSHFLSVRSLPNIEQVDDTGYTRYFTIDKQACKVTAIHRQDKCGFDVSMTVPRPEHIKPTLMNLSRVLDCDADWMSIEQAITAAGFAVNDHTRGIRIPGVWDVFESGCRAILGQQVSVAAAINKTKKLVETVRVSSPGTGFPAPNEVTEQVIAQLGMPKSRKQTLINFATYMNDSENYKQVLCGDTSGLLALKGIGPWTCQYIQMRGLSHPDVWIPNDLAILRQCEKHSLNADAAKPWSSYLTLVLWHDYMENT